MIRQASPGIWCDDCKDVYGWDKQVNDWHSRAKSIAFVTIISESERGQGRVRNYCADCSMKYQMESGLNFQQMLDLAKGRIKSEQVALDV